MDQQRLGPLIDLYCLLAVTINDRIDRSEICEHSHPCWTEYYQKKQRFCPSLVSFLNFGHLESVAYLW